MSQWVHPPFDINAYVQHIEATNPFFNHAHFFNFWGNLRVQFRQCVVNRFLAGLSDPAVQAHQHFTIPNPASPSQINEVIVSIEDEGYVEITVVGIVYQPNNHPNSSNRAARFFSIAASEGRAWFNQALQDCHILNPDIEIEPLDSFYGFNHVYTGSEKVDQIRYYFWNAPQYLAEQFAQQTGAHFAAIHQAAVLASNNNI